MKNMLKQAMLGMLRYAPMSGYDLEKMINVSISHFWHAKLSQIYRTLKKMEEDGLVTSEMQEQEGARSKRVYTITPAGIEDFDAWLATIDTELDEIKLPSLVRTFFMGLAETKNVKDQIALWQRLHQQQLEYYQAILPPTIAQMMQERKFEHEPQDRFFWFATLRFGELYEQMTLQWLAELSEQAEQLGYIKPDTQEE